MPFTFAHPLYIAPLKAAKPAYFSLTGLVLGSMSPDFEYFIALEPYQTIGHSFGGLIYQAIPLSIMLAYLFHYVVKAPLAKNLPALGSLDRKAYRLAHGWKLNTVQSWLVFLASVVIGFYSHLFIDACTHYSGMFVTKFPVLRESIAGIPLYKWFQRSLSIVGLIIEAMLLYRFINKAKLESAYTGAATKLKMVYWAIVLSCTLLTLALKLIFTSSSNYIGIAVVAPISGFMLGILLASIVHRLYRRK
ncbi:DUF4184 family protein [Paenibacillus sp. TAF43_2]|uniref:DUF4184 family protein n=1 Tax=Paenibacillus sp. TAF43_2 TaxID=3233069 RepID=UPI003F9CA3DE